jgi:hypothetical protein
MQHDLQRDNSGAFASMIAATTFVVLLISACVAQQCVPNAAADRSVLTSQSTQPPMSRPLAVEVEAQVFDCPPTIVLRWRPLTANPTTGSVQLWRRLPNDLRVAAPIVVLPANATNYVDTNVTIGVAYEYIVMVAPQSTPILSGGLGVPQGYIRSGIQIPVVRKRGAVLIVIERQLQTALAAIPRARGNIDLLRSDLTAEGWTSTVIAVNANDTVVTCQGRDHGGLSRRCQPQSAVLDRPSPLSLFRQSESGRTRRPPWCVALRRILRRYRLSGKLVVDRQ